LVTGNAPAIASRAGREIGTVGSLSAVVLSYNEATMLEITLPAVRRAVDQIVVLDMESDDGSDLLYRDILAPHDIVVKYPRRNLFDFGFAHARNFGACFANGDWLIAIDADELVHPEELCKFRSKNLGAMRTLRVRRRNYLPSEGVGLADVDKLMTAGEYSEEWHCRIARNSPIIQWQGILHEEIWDGAATAFATSEDSGLIFHHLNAFKDSPVRDKLELYYYLTLKAVAYPRFQYGTNPYWYTEFATAHLPTLLDHADAFCRRHGLDLLPKALIERRLIPPL